MHDIPLPTVEKTALKLLITLVSWHSLILQPVEEISLILDLFVSVHYQAAYRISAADKSNLYPLHFPTA